MSTDDREANQTRTEIIVIEIWPLCVFITIYFAGEEHFEWAKTANFIGFL